MLGKASETLAWKKPCEPKSLLHHRSPNSSFAAEAHDSFFPGEKKILILTPSHLSDSRGKVTIRQGQRCLNGSCSSPSQGKFARRSISVLPHRSWAESNPEGFSISLKQLRVKGQVEMTIYFQKGTNGPTLFFFPQKT